MLTREQAIAATAALVMLAHERHVKTPEGAEYYHLPIGSLIIAHPKLHVIKEKHLKLVYAGGKAYGVPKDARVWVDKLTDMTNDAEMAEAPKYVTIGKPGAYGIHEAVGRMFMLGLGSNEKGGLTQYGLDALAQTHKQVPEGELKVPLVLDGKLLGWIPENYKAYTWVDTKTKFAYAKAPDGGWWNFSADGSTQLGKTSEDILNKKAADTSYNGQFIPYQPPENISAEEHPPPHPETPEGPAPAKVTIGGIPVESGEIGSAIEILQNDKSTNVKLPLKHAGHKLQHMDYLGISKEELKKFPELKVPKGTKQKHVGQVKVAVLHHLTEKLKTLTTSDAQQAQGKTAGEKAKADAKSAQVMTPGTVEVGGKLVTKDEIQHILTKLEGSQAAVSALLKDTVLEGTGASLVPQAKAHVKESGHAPEGIKTAVIHVLQEKLGIAATQDVNSGHESALHAAEKELHESNPWNVNEPPSMQDLLDKVMETAKPIPVEIDGKKVGERPADSVIFQHKDKGASIRWARLVSGDWLIFSNSGTSTIVKTEHTAQVLDTSMLDGTIVPDNALDTATAAEKLAKIINDVTPALKDWSLKTGSTADFGEALAASLVRANGTGGVWLAKFPEDAFIAPQLKDKYALFSSSPEGERWYVTPKEVIHFQADTTVSDYSVPAQQVLGAVQAYMDKVAHEQAVKPTVVGPAAKTIILDGKPWNVTVPASAKVYYTSTSNAGQGKAHPDSLSVKIVQMPGGKWYWAEATESALLPAALQTVPFEEQVANGDLIPDMAAPPDYVESLKDLPETVEYLTTALGDATPGTYKNIYDKLVKAKEKLQAETVAKAHEPEKPVTATEALLKDGAIPPGKARQGDAANDINYYLAQAAVMLNHPTVSFGGGWEKYIVPDSNGLWEFSYTQGSAAEWYHLTKEQDGSTSAYHHTFSGGNSVSVDLHDAVSEYVHPNAIFMAENFSAGLEGTLYKYGHYYKPNGQAHLEIGPGGKSPALTGAQSKFTYHAAGHSGSKDVGAGYAAKALANMTEFHEQPKQASQVKPKAAPAKLWATPLVPNVAPGTDNHALGKPHYTVKGTDSSLLVHSDMSGSVVSPGGKTMTLSQDEIHTLAVNGLILDGYGTTVMVPGASPANYHVLGSVSLPVVSLASMLENWQQAAGDQAALSVLAKELNSVYSADQGTIISYIDAHGATNWSSQAEAITGLLSDLVHGPDAKAASGASQTEGAKFLKKMPDGITSPKDIFDFGVTGYAKSFPVQVKYPGKYNYSVMPFAYLDSAHLKAKIQLVSEDYGGGKVVGTHPASMNKQKKAAWLDAWTKGDMVTVFNIDASVGKVSPAHPGAPENLSTHQVFWAPFGKGEIPAAQDVEGSWTAPFMELPLPEIENYLISAGISHAENLTASEMRQWVKAHRNHNQLTVDLISKMAQDRFDNHEPPLSETPTWTEDIKPAKTYDVFLEDNTPATNWTTQAANDFVDDHSAELHDFAQQVLDEQAISYISAADPYNWGYGMRRDTIQKFLDTKAAAEEAERNKPVWEKTPGGASPVSSHPIYEIQDRGRHFFFKPATEPFLAEQEDQAGKIANAWGFKAPDSQLIEFDGKYGQAQAKLDPEGDMTYGAQLGFYDPAPVPWTELSQRQLSDVAREHVLDWALDNDDGRASNFLRMPDGSIVGIDKGRSWAEFGHWNGLAGDERMDERSAQVVTQLYQAVRDHKFSKDTADQTFIDVMHRAQKMQRMPDETLRKMLDTAFAHRTQYAGKYDTKEKLIQAAVDRKNHLAADFGKLWAGVYHDAGWDKAGKDASQLTASQIADQVPGTHMVTGGDPDYVKAIVVSPDGKVLALRRSGTHPTKALKWDLPGGNTEPGESPVDSIRREIEEETGQKVKPGDVRLLREVHDNGLGYIYVVRAPSSEVSLSWEHDKSAWADSEKSLGKLTGLPPKYTQPAAQVLKAVSSAPLPGLPEVPEPKLPLTRKGDQLYSGFSDPELLEHVNTVTVAGVPAFFGGAELEDGNILLWREFQGEGTDKPTLHGETGTHGPAYDKIAAWCRAHETSGPGAGPVDTANVSGEDSWHKGLLEGAKTISYHNQNGNKDYNQSRLAKMTDAQLQMESRLKTAEDVIAKGPDTSQYADFNMLYGSPELNVHAAKYYLAQVAVIEAAKDNGHIFEPHYEPSELPRWEPPADLLKKPEEEAPKAPPSVKVVLKPATRSHGVGNYEGGITSSLDKDGNYHASGSGEVNYPGSSWHVTLPDGETIVFSDGSQEGIELAHHGRIRFTAKHGDGLASLERIRSQLQSMGLEMKDADEDDLQLFYWRHLAHVLADRNDSASGTYGKMWNELAASTGFNLSGANGSGTKREQLVSKVESAGMDPATELAIWHKAWSHVTSPEQVQHFVSVQGYLPHLSHFDLRHPDKASGDPYWMRFDLKPSDVLDSQLPAHSYSGSTTEGALHTIRSGGTLGKEEQLRQIGAAHGMASNPYDSGATGYVYTRLNQESKPGVSLLLNPSVLARTSTYSFDGDEYGKTTSRYELSPFNFDSFKGNSDSFNETLVKNAVSVLDAVEVIRAHGGEPQRWAIIDQLHEIGIDKIRGVPVEKRVTSNRPTASELAIIKAAMKASQDQVDW